MESGYPTLNGAWGTASLTTGDILSLKIDDDDDTKLKTQVKNILSKIVWMLKDRVEVTEPTLKKQKMEEKLTGVE